MSDHPHYPRNTIQEALCELRLRPGDNFTWTPKLPGQLFSALGPTRFPGMEPVKELAVELMMDHATGQAQHRLVEGPPRVRYTSADESELVQVSPNLFAYNRIRSYDSWADMKERALDNWRLVLEHLAEPKIERIGLRYINSLPVGANDRVGDWLQSSDFIPSAFTELIGGLQSRIECQLGPRDRIVVIALRQEAVPTQILLDIDRSRDTDQIFSSADLLLQLDELHEGVWRVFRDAQGPRLKTLLEAATQ